MPKNTLETYTLAQIHNVIIASQTSTEAAEALNIKEDNLIRHLAKFKYLDSSLNFDTLKKLSIAEANNVFAKSYYRHMIAPKIDLNKFTFAYIHKAIIANKTLKLAATELGVNRGTLSAHLGKFRYHDKPLTFALFKKILPETAEAYWKEQYFQPMKAEYIDLKLLTFKFLHETFIKSKSHADAAKRLGVDKTTLYEHLANFEIRGMPLTFKILKELSVTDAEEYWGSNYRQLMTTSAKSKKHKHNSILSTDLLTDVTSAQSQINFKEASLETIHKIILESTSQKQAASKFGIVVKTLERYLAQSLYLGQNITYDLLKSLSIHDAQSYWGDEYQQPLKLSKIKLINVPFRTIIEIILKSQTIAEAATLSGVKADTLGNFLSKFKFEGKGLSFTLIKELSLDDISKLCDSYAEKLNNIPRVNLKLIDMDKIHSVVKQSANLSNAAQILGVNIQTLGSHLSKFEYKGAPLTFNIFQELTAEEAEDYWGELYYEEMKWDPISLEEISTEKLIQTILASANMIDCSRQLGISAPTLKSYLARFTYNNQTLDYQTAKKTSSTILENIFIQGSYQDRGMEHDATNINPSSSITLFNPSFFNPSEQIEDIPEDLLDILNIAPDIGDNDLNIEPEPTDSTSMNQTISGDGSNYVPLNLEMTNQMDEYYHLNFLSTDASTTSSNNIQQNLSDHTDNQLEFEENAYLQDLSTTLSNSPSLTTDETSTIDDSGDDPFLSNITLNTLLNSYDSHNQNEFEISQMREEIFQTLQSGISYVVSNINSHYSQDPQRQYEGDAEGDNSSTERISTKTSPHSAFNLFEGTSKRKSDDNTNMEINKKLKSKPI